VNIYVSDSYKSDDSDGIDEITKKGNFGRFISRSCGYRAGGEALT